MATLKCKNCEAPYGEPHFENCFLDGIVTIESCPTDKIVASSIEAEVPQSSDQSELSLHLSDHLNLGDKL